MLLPSKVEHILPIILCVPIINLAIGFSTRGCWFRVVGMKEVRFYRHVAEL